MRYVTRTSQEAKASPAHAALPRVASFPDELTNIVEYIDPDTGEVQQQLHVRVLDEPMIFDETDPANPRFMGMGSVPRELTLLLEDLASRVRALEGRP